MATSTSPLLIPCLLLILSSCTAALSCPSFCQCDSSTRTVTCRSQGLTQIPDNLPTDTIHLHLQQNLITKLDQQSISNLPQLQTLDLSWNKLEDVENDTFSETREMRRLLLGGNSLHSLDVDLPESVVELDLAQNYRFTDVFQLPASVQKLNMSHCGMFDIMVVFVEDSQLRELDLTMNAIPIIQADAFTNASRLEKLKISWNNGETRLHHINHTAFSTLTQLKHLEIQGNAGLSFIHKDLFRNNINLEHLDLSRNNISSFYSVAYSHLHKLKTLNIHSNPLVCNCALKWLHSTSVKILEPEQTKCSQPEPYRDASVLDVPVEDLLCTPPRILNYTQEAYFKIGSQAVLKCLVEGDPQPLVRWTIPSGRTFTYNDYLENPSDNRPSKESVLDQIYHRNGEIQKVAHKYQDELGPDRILLLSNGDLFISYVQRTDAGSYKCSVTSPGGNDTETMLFLLNYTIIKDITVASMIVGFSSAGIFFGFGLLVALIRYIVNRCAERQRKKSRSIKKIIGHLDAYRSQQLDKLKDSYGGHVGKMKEHAIAQMDRMRENYFTQIARIQEKCAFRMDHLRENYNTQMGKIKGYSNHQIEKIRENYNGQMIKIRDYGSGQLERLRETYRLQHQHLMKILEAMNIDNCRGIVDDSTAKANSVLFETKFTLDNIPDLNLDTMDFDTLETLNLDTLDNLSGGISSDFETAISDPEGISIGNCADLQVVEASVYQPKPEVHSEATQTEDVPGEMDSFVVQIDVDHTVDEASARIGGLMSSSII